MSDYHIDALSSLSASRGTPDDEALLCAVQAVAYALVHIGEQLAAGNRLAAHAYGPVVAKSAGVDVSEVSHG